MKYLIYTLVFLLGFAIGHLNEAYNDHQAYVEILEETSYCYELNGTMGADNICQLNWN